MADFIDAQIEDGLKTPGAEDVTAKYRGGPRKVVFEGGVYPAPDHRAVRLLRASAGEQGIPLPLRQRRARARRREMLATNRLHARRARPSRRTRPSSRELEAFGEIDRLNIGPVSTMKISWDQPHEGNMFEFLWKRRSIERAW